MKHLQLLHINTKHPVDHCICVCVRAGGDKIFCTSKAKLNRTALMMEKKFNKNLIINLPNETGLKPWAGVPGPPKGIGPAAL